jgi:putative phosphoesterase
MLARPHGRVKPPRAAGRPGGGPPPSPGVDRVRPIRYRSGMSAELRVGVISDTHGLLRPEAVAALRGSDHILHAGDIGGASILKALRALAPVTAVRGNNDGGKRGRDLPDVAEVELGGVRLCVVHIRGALTFDPAERGIQVVVYGHTHWPDVATRDGVLYLNPGSAGPRRFHLPVSLARMRIQDGRVEATLVPLPVS